jgi:hypothetical protein
VEPVVLTTGEVVEVPAGTALSRMMGHVATLLARW